MTNPPYSKIGALRNPPQEKELFFNLYLHVEGDQNNFKILDPKLPNYLGMAAVNDWVIYDKRGLEGAKVVARAQGINIQCSTKTQNWICFFSIAFEDANASFKGSSLEVMGSYESGQWAIVGGTGEFTLARGIIHKTEVERLGATSVIFELKIHGFYTPMRGEAVPVNEWTLGP